jgi:hypothetical protein
MAYAAGGWATFAVAALVMARRGVGLDTRSVAIAAAGAAALGLAVRLVTG